MWIETTLSPAVHRTQHTIEHDARLEEVQQAQATARGSPRNTHCEPGEFQPSPDTTNCSATADLEPLFYEFGVDLYLTPAN